MADNDKRKFDLPWATLLPVAAVLAGIVVQYKPLVSERPSVPIEKTAPIIAAQDVDARLWQDPIGVAQKQKTLLDEKIEKGVAKKALPSRTASPRCLRCFIRTPVHFLEMFCYWQ